MGCVSSVPSAPIRVDPKPDPQRDLTTALDSIQFQQKEFDYISKITHLDTSILYKLFDKFTEISNSKVNDGVIDADEFSHALGMNNNILSHRMFALFNVTRTEKMNFREFAMATSVLSSNADRNDKIRFSFDLYDLNKDNKIDHHELQVMLKAALQENGILLTNEQIEHICASTLKASDIDGNGFIEFEEYKQLVAQNPRLLIPFTVNLDELFRKGDNRKVNADDPLIRSQRALADVKFTEENDSKRSIDSIDNSSIASYSREDSFEFEPDSPKAPGIGNGRGTTRSSVSMRSTAVVINDIDKVLD